MSNTPLIVCGTALAVLIFIGIVFISMVMEDEAIKSTKWVEGMNCPYLLNFIVEQEKLNFKHQWYTYAIDRIDRGDCQ